MHLNYYLCLLGVNSSFFSVGFMTFWFGPGSGSADPCLGLINPDSNPNPAIFVFDLEDANITNLKKKFSVYYLLKVHHFSKKKN